MQSGHLQVAHQVCPNRGLSEETAQLCVLAQTGDSDKIVSKQTDIWFQLKLETQQFTV